MTLVDGRRQKVVGRRRYAVSRKRESPGNKLIAAGNILDVIHKKVICTRMMGTNSDDGDLGSETTCQFLKEQQLESELDWDSVQGITSGMAESCH